MSRPSRQRPGHNRWLAPALALAGSAALSACGEEPWFETDSRPIGLLRGPLGPSDPSAASLIARARGRPGEDITVVVDTGSALSILPRGPCPRSGGIYRGSLELLDATWPGVARRASFHGIDLLDTCLVPAGDGGGPTGVLGGAVLANFSVDLSFPPSMSGDASMTLWRRLAPADDFLSGDGNAVLRFRLRGGGDVSTLPDGPNVSVPASRVILRACIAPRTFSPDEPRETCGLREAVSRATGVNLLLAVATGVGPLVISEKAWARVAETLGVPPDEGAALPLLAPSVREEVPALWTSVPRLALVDAEDTATSPGPCAELARARRIEWVEAHHGEDGTCVEPCDVADGASMNSAAYVEIGGGIATAVVAETTDLMRGLNSDVPSLPQVDGIIGAAVLAGMRLEVDYRPQPTARVVTRCTGEPDRQTCYTAPRCPRLSSSKQVHSCFGLPNRGPSPACGSGG